MTDTAGTHDTAPEQPHEASDNTGIGETGSFPGEHGAAKAKQVSSSTEELREHAEGDAHERTGTPTPAEGGA